MPQLHHSARSCVMWLAMLWCCCCCLQLTRCRVAEATAAHAEIRPPPELAAAAHDAVLLYREAIAASAAQQETRAIALFRASIDMYPLAHACNNMGLLLFDLGDAASRREALAMLAQGARVARAANDSETLVAIESNVGLFLRSQNMESVALCLEAIEHYDAALELDPLHVPTLYNKAAALYKMREIDAAEPLLRQVLALEPRHVGANMDLGGILYLRRDIAQAVRYQDVAITNAESVAAKHGAIANKGNFLRGAGLLVQALESFEQAYALVPDDPMAVFNLVVGRRPLCIWDRIDDLHDKLIEIAERELSAGSGFTPLLPFEATLMKVSDAFRKRLAIADSRQTDQAVTVELMPSRLSSSESPALPPSLRIGYLSYDFRDHAMGQLTLGFIENHDKRAVETFCYSYGPNDESEWRQRAESGCGVFRDVAACSDLEAAKQIALDQIDIVVDLMAHTTGARVGISALKPSRVLANYLGYPGTTGSAMTDFVVVDRLVVPPERAQVSMTEQVVYLPFTYQSNLHESEPQLCVRNQDDDAALLTPSDYRRCSLATRSDHGLPASAIVFCNFNTINKMEPVSFALWMRILHQVPGSVLWLLEPPSEDSLAIVRTLRHEAQALGIHSSRIIFAQWVDKREHIARLTLADIFLDSLVYNAHSTATDALWANVPVVTLWGDSFPSRVAASLIQNALPQFPELVPHSVKEYEALAIRLALSRALLLRYRSELASEALRSPLFDSKQTTQSLERSYELMHDLTHRVSGSPSHSGKPKKRFQLVVTPEAKTKVTAADHSLHEANTRARVRTVVDEGLRHQQLGHFQEAQYFYQLALQTDSSHADALHLLATLWFKRGDARRAHMMVQKVVQLNPGVVLYRMNAAHIAASLGETTSAANQLWGVLRLEPSNLVAFNTLVEIFVQAQDFDTVVQIFRKFGDPTLRLSSSSENANSADEPHVSDKEREQAFLRFSYALAMTQREREAVDLLENAMAHHPSYHRAGYNLVALYNRQELYRAGEAWLVKVVLAESASVFEAQGRAFRRVARSPAAQHGKVVAIYCYEYGNEWWDEWGPSSLGTGLGGSEEAVVFLSKELQRLGYWVEVYGNPPAQDLTTGDSSSEGVKWYPHYAYDPEDAEVDVFIAWRYHASLLVGRNARARYLWMHDVPSAEAQQSELFFKRVEDVAGNGASNDRLTNGIFCVSAFQASFFPAQVREQNLIILTTNGLEPSHFEAGSRDDEPANRSTKFVYGSAPNRGLDRVLRAWPQIRTAIPEATLTVYYGFTPAFNKWGGVPGFSAWKREIETLLTTLPGVHYAGLVGHEELARGYASAGFYLYPTTFGETSCVTLMKAMAAGAIPITSRFKHSALQETCQEFDLGPAQALDDDDPSPEWLDLWVASVIQAARDESGRTRALRAQMKAFARAKYRWSSVAAQWQRVFESTAG